MERARFERAMRPLAIRAAAGPAARPWPATRTRAPLRLLGRFRRGRLRRYRRPSTRRRSPARWHADAGRIGWSGRWFRREATDAPAEAAVAVLAGHGAGRPSVVRRLPVSERRDETDAAPGVEAGPVGLRLGALDEVLVHAEAVRAARSGQLAGAV